MPRCAVVTLLLTLMSSRAAFLANKPKLDSSNIVRSQLPLKATGVSVSGKHTQRLPRIYFLFLAVDKISNFGVWQSFFDAAPTDRYRAFIHCKSARCKSFASVFPALLGLVPTVGAAYCADLVTPMNQLLASAILDDPHSANPEDKFVFVSDSTLPAKPFSHVYQRLIQRTGSDFCMFPAKDWADEPVQITKNGKPESGHDLAIKTHQWITLSRSHSERSVRLWREGVMRNLMTNFRLNEGGLWQNLANRTFGDNHNFGCLDEYWHMYTLFGPWTITETEKRSETTEYHYADLTNSPIQIRAEAGWQGTCDTFALWSEYRTTPFEMAHGKSKSAENPWMTLYSALDVMSIPHDSSSGPAWWDTISRQGIKAIRDSDFLFVRKFIDNPTLAYGGDFAVEYPQIILAA